MEEYKKVILNEEEYDLILFYRKLPEHKKEKFLKLIASLEKVLITQKDA